MVSKLKYPLPGIETCIPCKNANPLPDKHTVNGGGGGGYPLPGIETCIPCKNANPLPDKHAVNGGGLCDCSCCLQKNCSPSTVFGFTALEL